MIPKILHNEIHWVRPDSTFPPKKPELRTPLFWLVRVTDELYFVNLSSEVLSFVKTEKVGLDPMATDAITVTENNELIYKNVAPNDAVLIDLYNPYYDDDYLIQTEIELLSPSMGKISFRTSPEKGGVKDQVLMWDSLEASKYVSVTKQEREEETQ